MQRKNCHVAYCFRARILITLLAFSRYVACQIQIFPANKSNYRPINSCVANLLCKRVFAQMQRMLSSIVFTTEMRYIPIRRSFIVFVSIRTLKKKIGCCNNIDSKTWHSIFIWLQQSVFGCSSKFLVALAYSQYQYDFDRLT